MNQVRRRRIAPEADHYFNMKSCSKHMIRILMGVVLMAAILHGIAVGQTPIGTRIDNRGKLRYQAVGGGQQDSLNSNLVSTVVDGPFTLKLEKSVSPASAVPGDTVTYTIVAWNSGSTVLSGVYVADTLQNSLTVLFASHGSQIGNIVRWDIGLLPIGARDTLFVSAVVHQAVAAGTLIPNFCFGGDTTGSRVVAWADLSINAASIFSIKKSVSSGTVIEGDTLTYGVTLVNAGNTTLTAVSVRDTLPSLVQYLSGSPGVQFLSGISTYLKDSLVIGQSDSFSVKAIVRTQIAGGTIILNTAYANTDQTPLQSSSAASVVRGEGALSFFKTASPDTAQFGDTVRFVLQFRNTGNIPLTNVVITDTLPFGLTYLSGTLGSQFANGVYSFRRDTLDRTLVDSAVVLSRVSDASNLGHTVVNQAHISSDQTPMQSAEASFVYKPSQSGPSVGFVKSGPSQAVSGDSVVYSISLSNRGNGALTGVVIIDTLDAQMRFVSATQNGSYEAVNHRIIWQFPLLDTLANISCSATVVMSDTLSRPTMVLNRAAFASNEITGVRSQVQTLVLPPALLTILKTASAQHTYSGDTLKYALTVRNISSVRADSVVVIDVLPDELDFVSALPGAVYTSGTKTLVWMLDSLSAGAQQQITISTIVKNDAQRGEHDVINTAVAQWRRGNGNLRLESSSQASVQVLVPYLQIQKQAIRRIVEIGDLALYTITVTNLSSNTTAYNLTIVDTPPLGFNLVPGSSFRDSLKIQDPARSGKDLRWNLADSLAPGATIHLTYRLVVGAGALDGTGINSARAVALAPGNISIESSVASDQVEIRAGVFTDRGLVIGKVFYDDNENKYQDDFEEGIKDVELIVEDGTRVVTGDDGKYSLPDIAPGDHVIRLLEQTLPAGDELLLGYDEFANVPSSRFVKVTEAGIARSDFYVRRKKAEPAQISQEVTTVGPIAIRRTATPKYLVFVNDEHLAPVSIKGTQFEPGKAILRPEAYPTLRALADYAREFPDQNIAISGHTDAKPIHTKEYPSNKELSEARAIAVRDYLVRKEQIDAVRITTIGFGETQPVASNATKNGRALNRRVEVSMSSVAVPFENYFKTVRIEVSLDYEGAVPISNLTIIDNIDTSFHFVEGSSLFDHRAIVPTGSGQHLVWTIDSVGTRFHKTLTYDLRVYSPLERSETIHSRSTLRYAVAESTYHLDGSCVTMNVVSKLTRRKPVRFVMSGVLFDVGKATLKEDAANSLTGAVEVLMAYPHARATIDGYTDSRPIKTKVFPSNVALSHARALSVRDRLITDFRIDSSRIKATGWGELKPVASNSSEKGRKANRRVEIDIFKPDTTDAAPLEGYIDSSEALTQRVDNIRSVVTFESSGSVSVGDRIYARISINCPVEKASVASSAIDSLPAGIVPIPNSIILVRGIDSAWTEDGALRLAFTQSDSVHTYSFAAEVTNDAAGTPDIEHYLIVRRAYKNEKVFIQRSQPLIIQWKNQRSTDDH